MTNLEAINWATGKLKKNKITSPALDAEILLALAIKKPKEFFFSHPERKLTASQLAKFKKIIARRAKHEPTAYIIGQKCFYGLDFFVDKNVLIPRPETEMLVENIINQKLSAIIDVGTGSGAIAISLAKNIPGAKVFATEISPSAIKLAKKNIKHHKVAVELLRGNLLAPIFKKIINLKSLVVAANLPYLTTIQWRRTPPEIKKYEPRTALDGGKDGLKYYRKLLEQIKNLKNENHELQITILFEIDPSQTKSIAKLIRAIFLAAKIEIKKDLAGRDRLVIFKI